MPFGNDPGIRNPRPLLGAGALGMAADISKARNIWNKLNIEAQMNGEAFPSFDEWMQMQTQDVSMSNY
jgi:hypothetical protein